MSNTSFYPNQEHAARNAVATAAAATTNTSVSNEQNDTIDTIHSAAQYITGAHNNSTNKRIDNPNIRREPNGQQIIAQIHQSTNNIERLQNNRTIKESLAEAIWVQSKKEGPLRKATISCIIKSTNPKEISAFIDEEWVHKLNQAPVTYWGDKEHLHCQFINPEAKNNFLSSGLDLMAPISGNIVPPNEAGEHFKRRPVRIIINNVRSSINTERIMEILKNCLDFDAEINEVKSGKPHPVTKTRCVLFKINGHGLRILINKLDGEIPYADKNTQTKARLRAKINCKPWQCRDCGAIGTHQCDGKRCRNCSNKGHTAKECRSATKFCGNCKKRGHKSTELHCPRYLNEVAREIRKMDIPIDMLEDKQSRLSLAQNIQLK